MTHAAVGVQPGWMVHDREGVELGAVTRVDERSLWITRGRILRREMEIPKSLVQEAEEGHVDLSVSKDELSD